MAGRLGYLSEKDRICQDVMARRERRKTVRILYFFCCSTASSASDCAAPTSRSQFFSTYSGGPPLFATCSAIVGVLTMSMASHGHQRSHKEQPMQRSRSMSQNVCRLG